MTRSEQWHIVIRVTAVIAPLGGLIGPIPGYFLGGSDAESLVTGGLIGLLVAGGMALFDVSWAVGLISRRWREAPFLVVLFSRSLAWLSIIVAGISIPLLTVSEVPPSDLLEPPVPLTILVSFLMALLINFIGQVNRLLGRGVLINLILGRYHRPREEVRIFLFVDLRDSSGIAARLGDLRYHSFLKRYIGDVTAGAVRFGAEVHRYVGDEVILTWNEARGVADAACIRAVFAMMGAFEAARDGYANEFGVVPQLWAGLHLGSVVTGEIGTFKHEIAYLGDTLNTAARIEEACRALGRPFLASAPVVNALEMPVRAVVESLGPRELRGIPDPVELFAIEPGDPS